MDIPEGADAKGDVIAGIRPEHFEDAKLVDEDARGRGTTFKAKIDVLESMGSELYAHFNIEGHGGVQSKDLEELAQDAGAADLPSGEEGQVTARLSAESEREGGRGDRALDRRSTHPAVRPERRPLAALGLAAELAPQPLDHFLVPGMRAQQHVAQA